MKSKDEEIKEYYLSCAGFVIKVSLFPTQQIYYKRFFKNFIEEIWGGGEFLTRQRSKADFEIEVANKIDRLFLVKKNEDVYYFSWKINLKEKRAITFYHLSPLLFSGLIKEVLVFLLRERGLMIHASSCVDDKGVLYIFMAPSGGGKSTTADTLARVKFFKKVGDDIFIIKRDNKGWKFYSPPFVEKENLPLFVQTNKVKIFFVKKAKDCSKRKLKKEGLLKRFLSQVWLIEGEVDKSTLSLAAAFIDENDFFELENCLDSKKLAEVVR